MAKRKLPKTLSRAEARALLDQPNLNAPTGLRDRCLLELMYRGGMRVSEPCKVRLRDYRPAERQLLIRDDVGKGGVEGTVYLEEETFRFLELWKATRRGYANGSPLLFVTLTGNQLSRRDVWEMVRRRAAKAGIEKPVHPHMLRHTYASELLADGFTLLEVQKLLRHADIRTTAIYLHVTDRELAAKVSGRKRAT